MKMSGWSKNKGFWFTITAVAVVLSVIVWVLNSKPAGHPVIKRELVTADSIMVLEDSLILPILYHGNPDLRQVKGTDRKVHFVQMMLPSIMLAQKKIDNERLQIEALNGRLKEEKLSHSDSVKVDSVLTYYKAKTLDQAIKCLHPQPISVILAQAALESGWGTSRFFIEANNVFGIWSYNPEEERIAAGKNRGEKTIYLRKYDNLYGSVYDYLKTVARVPAYKKLRKARLESSDPYKLIQYLTNYSELRQVYFDILGSVIRHNDLTKYYHYKLVDVDENDPFWQSL